MHGIYEPKGRAGEYADYAVNLYRGCRHGCTYCYVPGAIRMGRQDFYYNPAPRWGILDTLLKQAPNYRYKKVLMSFSCDPYQPIDRRYLLTRRAIKILNDNGVAVSVLTKAGRDSMRDFDLLSKFKANEYGTTLTFLSAGASCEYEPHAALPVKRLEALIEASFSGIRTWVSLEPVIDPAQSLDLIEITLPYVDVYKIGMWNHDKRARDIDWQGFLNRAVGLLEEHNKDFFIKGDLAAAKNHDIRS